MLVTTDAVTAADEVVMTGVIDVVMAISVLATADGVTGAVKTGVINVATATTVFVTADGVTGVVKTGVINVVTAIIVGVTSMFVTIPVVDISSVNVPAVSRITVNTQLQFSCNMRSLLYLLEQQHSCK